LLRNFPCQASLNKSAMPNLPKRRVYVLEGKSEEEIAMAMAVTSRSPEPFDKILSQTDSKRSANFLEKFYITYGHGSIADTAFIHIAIENISQLAVKALEDTRLAAYQEKSTRYQIIDRLNVAEPDEIKKSKYHKRYQEVVNSVFDLYDAFVETLLGLAREKNKRKKGESEAAYENRIRVPVIDRCRLVLPAATLCNVGATMSGRSIEYTIAKLLSHPLSEVKSLGEEIKKVAIKKLPILVKYTDPIKYKVAQEKILLSEARKILGPKRLVDNKFVCLVQYDRNALDRVLAAVLERFSNQPYYFITKNLKRMSQKKKAKLFDTVIGDRKLRHDKPLRELEETAYTFDVVCDFGAFKDLQRHRMTAQTIQPFTTHLGYVEPLNLDETGMVKEYHKVMRLADEAYRKIAKDYPLEAQYIIPMAYRRRFLFHMNLREALYIIELRSRPQGHISYRRVVWDMWREINRVHPYFAKHIKVDFSEV